MNCLESTLLAIFILLAGLAIGALVGWLIRKTVAEKTIGSAEIEAKRLIQNAQTEAEAKRRELGCCS